MTQFFQSAFLQSLGYAIANSLWQMALVWLVYLCISNIRGLGAAAKYRCAVAAQLIGFTWFLVTFQFYYTQYSHALASAGKLSQAVQAVTGSPADLSSHVLNWMVKGEQLLPYVSVAYLLLIVFLCVRWAMGYRQAQVMRNDGLQAMPGEWIAFIDRVAAELKIGRKVGIFLSERIHSPLTIGFLKPVILVPLASINHLTPQQLEAVLLHELAHIKRYDYLVNIVLSMVEITLFFNPFTQLISKGIRKERENCCDDWVLQFRYDASVYAEALMRIAYLQASPSFAMAAAGKKSELLGRVKRMVGERESRFSYRKQLLAFLIVTGILSSIAWLNPRVQHREQASAGATKRPVVQYTVEPMAVSIDNPLFNPVFFLSKPLKDGVERQVAAAQHEADEALAGLDLSVPLNAVTAVTPLVANAMEQAASALQGIEIDQLSINRELSKVRAEIADTFQEDSIFATPKVDNKPFELGLRQSMKAMQSGIEKAKAAIAMQFSKKQAGKPNDKANLDLALDKLGLDAHVLEQLDEWTGPALENLIRSSIQLSADVLKDLPSKKSATTKAAKKQAQSSKEKQETEEENQEQDQ